MRNQITHYDIILPYHTTSHMIKAGYYPRSHMTGSISNQFTSAISALLYYDKYFIIQKQEISLVGYAYCHSCFGLVAILAYPTRDISRYLVDDIYIFS